MPLRHTGSTHKSSLLPRILIPQTGIRPRKNDHQRSHLKRRGTRYVNPDKLRPATQKPPNSQIGAVAQLDSYWDNRRRWASRIPSRYAIEVGVPLLCLILPEPMRLLLPLDSLSPLRRFLGPLPQSEPRLLDRAPMRAPPSPLGSAAHWVSRLLRPRLSGG